MTDTKIAELLEDLASRHAAGLHERKAAPGETVVEGLRRRVQLRDWEWSALQAGETAGDLPQVLRRLAAARHERAALSRQLLGSLLYPLFVLCMCGAVAFLALRTGHAPRGWIWLSAGLLCGVVAMIVWGTRRLRDPTFDGDRLPLLGRLSRCAGEVPYLVALRALYGAGVGLRQAHPQATPAAAVPWVRARLYLASQGIEQGETLTDALRRVNAVTPETLELIGDGEATGQLEDALGRALTRRRDELQLVARRLARILGGLAYAYAALSVGWLALRFYSAHYAGLR